MTNLQLLYEDWRYVPKYEGLYIVSNRGNVISLTRVVSNNRGQYVVTHRKRRTEILKIGYEQIKLCKNGFKSSHLIHRLVALCFIPNPNNLPEVNHIYGNKLDNLWYLLEWVTQQANSDHKWANLIDRTDFADKLRKSGRAEKIGNSHRGGKSVNAKKVRDIESGLIYECVKDAAKAKGINYSILKVWLRGDHKNKSTLEYLPLKC